MSELDSPESPTFNGGSWGHECRVRHLDKQSSMKLSDQLEDLRLSAESEYRAARKRAQRNRANPRWKSGENYWKGMQQAYLNAKALAISWELMQTQPAASASQESKELSQ